MKTVLRVEGMHCAGCAGSVERALKRIEGVSEAKVELERKRAVVEHSERVAPDALTMRMVEIGFKAAVLER